MKLDPEIDQRVVYGIIEECDWLTDEQQSDMVKLANDMGPFEQLNVALARLTARALAHAVKNALGDNTKTKALLPASFNGIEFPAPTPIGVYEGDGHPAARAKYEPEPEGAEET